jgi:hypothetical protein
MAAGHFAQLWSEFFFLILEVIEFLLYQFVILQGAIQGGDEWRAKIFLARLDCGFEPLCLAFKCPDLRVAERNHRAKVWGFARQFMEN